MIQKNIEAKIAEYQVPYLGCDLLTAKALKSIDLDSENLKIELVLGFPVQSLKKTMVEGLEKQLAAVAAGRKVIITLREQIEPHGGKQGIPGLAQVKNMIAVASGKGGVGKSTVAINLALALAAEGAAVGILDADIYGPSQPSMLGTKEKKPIIENRTIQPIMSHGLQSMSIGYLVDKTAAMVWRGPMLGKALEQLVYDTKWQALDYLVVDLPPGTGDVQLTLCQKLPVSGALMVTTPQDLALVDVARACEMFNKLQVPILGVVENMSMYHCPQCGHEAHLFGTGGGAKLANEFHVDLLGEIPLSLPLREFTDSGKPLVVAEPQSQLTQCFKEIALKVAAKVSLQPKDYSAKFPKIVIKHDKKEV